MDAFPIAAVVVSHQSAASIDACLSRLRGAAGVAEIRVVDNASADATLAVVQRHALADARLRFIANPDNPGFAAACNQGAADSTAPWLAFVNPDCMVEVDTLERMLRHADAADGELLLGADLVDAAGVRDGAARRNDPDFAAMLRGPLRAGRGRPLDVEADDAVALQPVQAVSGALMLLPRALFDRIGGFDAGYRLHAEDLDLCRRAREAGAAIAVANDVRVLHLRGVSARSRPFFVEWHKHRGLWRYFSRFEAPTHGPLLRAGVWLAVWMHWLAGLPRTLLESMREDAP
ncbi:glycosyltransferase family 2 protein [Luteimonas sp. MJ174]|uniref:glycosyltransferase family 2 protein n=1 Tax=Luteimonas sp. MJ174 TaxID=3129237 RepID=UPI0031BB4098